MMVVMKLHLHSNNDDGGYELHLHSNNDDDGYETALAFK